MFRFRVWALGALVAVLCASVSIAGCGGQSVEDDVPTLSVVTSTVLIADWARQVGGEWVSVRLLVPPGADVHTLELSSGDVRAISEADLVIINGAGLEAAYESVVVANAAKLLVLAEELEAAGLELHPFVGAAHHDEHDAHEDEEGHEEGHDDEHEDAHEDEEGHEEGHDDEHEDAHEDEEGHEEGHDDAHSDGHGHAHGSEDPHFWFDADLVVAAVEAIAESLALHVPDRADDFANRADIYIAEIRDADAEVRERLADLPPSRRFLVTFHDAFGYFARRYGLTIAGFVVEGPEQGVSANAIADLIELIEHEQITRIYREPQFESTVLDAVARETGAKVKVIWSQPQGEASTYLALLRANAEALAGE